MILNIQRQPGANIISVVDRIQEVAAATEGLFAFVHQVSVLTDRTDDHSGFGEDVQFELMLTVALVVMVIFLFLRTWLPPLFPSIAVPLSLVGTFGVMYLLGLQPE